MVRERIRRWCAGSVLTPVIYSGWAFMLLAYVAMNTHRRNVNEVEPFSYNGSALPVKLIGTGDTTSLFSPGSSFAVMFVSTTCGICTRDAKRLKRALLRLPVDHHAIVLIDPLEEAMDYAVAVDSDEAPVVIPVDSAAFYSLNLRVVPSYLVTSSDGGLELATSGRPTRWQTWTTRPN